MGDTGDRLAIVIEQPVVSRSTRDDAPIPVEDLLIEAAGALHIVGEQIGPDDLTGQAFVCCRVGEWR